MQLLPSLRVQNGGMLRSSSSPASLLAAIAALCWLTMLLCANSVQAQGNNIGQTQYSVPENDDPNVIQTTGAISLAPGSGGAVPSGVAACALSALVASESGGPQASQALSSCYSAASSAGLTGGGGSFSIQTNTNVDSSASTTPTPSTSSSSASSSATMTPSLTSLPSLTPSASATSTPNAGDSKQTQLKNRIGTIPVLVAGLVIAAATVWFMDELLEMLV